MQLKGFIEVRVYEDNMRTPSTYKMLFPVKQIAVSEKWIMFNSIKYRYYNSYEEIKKLIREAQ